MNKKLLIAAIFAIAAAAAGLHHPAKPPTSSTQSTPTARQGANDISTLTAQQRVADYLQQHQRLPDYYLRKGEARKLGWDPSKGNLCNVLPGRAIGGERVRKPRRGVARQSKCRRV